MYMYIYMYKAGGVPDKLHVCVIPAAGIQGMSLVDIRIGILVVNLDVSGVADGAN